jgi:hypothetical protein
MSDDAQSENAAQLLSRLEAETHALRADNTQLRERVGQLETRFTEVETESRDLSRLYAQVAHENEGLASLYVAISRLHSTLDPEEVTGILNEILIELVGAEEFAIFVVDERSNELKPISVEGPPVAPVAVGEGRVGRAMRDGEPLYGDPDHGGPCVVIPLRLKAETVGALVIHRMLRHRSGFDVVARQLLHLLSAHAATALMASRLYSATDRRVRTAFGFLELMKDQARAGPGTPSRA